MFLAIARNFRFILALVADFRDELASSRNDAAVLAIAQARYFRGIRQVEFLAFPAQELEKGLRHREYKIGRFLHLSVP